MKKIVYFLITLFVGSVNASVIDFEGGLNPLFNYNGVSTLMTPLSANSGYDAVGAFTGTPRVAYNPSETSPSTFSWAGGGTFDLTSFVIAGAWGSQTLTIEGLLNNVVQHTSFLAVDNVTVDVFSPGWFGIDAFRITTGNDYVRANNVSGSGQHWALDSLTINQNNTTSVPEPTSFVLLALGLAGLSSVRRKRMS